MDSYQATVYRKLVENIIAYGYSHPKKHGKWYVLNVLDKALILDTWNGAIWVYDDANSVGCDVDGNVVGFQGNHYPIAASLQWCRLKNFPDHMLFFWYAHSQIKSLRS